MDIPRPEEDDTLIAVDPLEIVEHVLTRRESRRSTAPRTAISPSPSPATGRTTSCGSPGARKPTACNCACRSTSRPAARRRGAAQELINLINQRVWLGHFEVWPDAGEVVFRHALALPGGERPSLAQTASMIDAAYGGGRPLLSGVRVPHPGQQIREPGDDRLHVRNHRPSLKRAGQWPARPILLAGAGRMGGALLVGWRDARLVAPDQVFIRDPAPGEEARAAAAAGARLDPTPAMIADGAHRRPGDEAAGLARGDRRTGAEAHARGGDGLPAGRRRVGGARRPVSRRSHRPSHPDDRHLGARRPDQSRGHGRRGQRSGRDGCSRRLGELVELPDERLMDAATAASGSGPAYLYAFVEALAEAGAAAGLPAREAERLARSTVIGAARLMETSELAPAELRRQVDLTGRNDRSGARGAGGRWLRRAAAGGRRGGDGAVAGAGRPMSALAVGRSWSAAARRCSRWRSSGHGRTSVCATSPSARRRRWPTSMPSRPARLSLLAAISARVSISPP